MKTKGYTVWTENVIEFIETITMGTTIEMEVLDHWLDGPGLKAFSLGQSHYARSAISIYQGIKAPISQELFDVAKGQIAAGFDNWFQELLKKFPLLSGAVVEGHYAVFKESCMDTAYNPYFAMRASVIKMLSDKGQINDNQAKREVYQWLRDAIDLSIEANQEYAARSMASTTSIVRTASSAVLHKAAKVEKTPTQSVALQQDLQPDLSQQASTPQLGKLSL